MHVLFTGCSGTERSFSVPITTKKNLSVSVREIPTSMELATRQRNVLRKVELRRELAHLHLESAACVSISL